MKFLRSIEIISMIILNLISFIMGLLLRLLNLAKTSILAHAEIIMREKVRLKEMCGF